MNDARAIEPIFVIGRQHSGNTVITHMFGKLPGILGRTNENKFFEHWLELERIKDVRNRFEGVTDLLGPDMREDMEWRNYAENSFLSEEAASECLKALDMYVEAMRYLMLKDGKVRWVQKATSYIFYVDLILKALPKAKFVYPIRSPFDITASIKQRALAAEKKAPGLQHLILSNLTAWNKGGCLAERYMKQYSENFLIIKYEDWVRSPESIGSSLCSFVGEEFQKDILNLPLVNTSVSPYQVVGKGVTSAKTNYFADVLSDSEVSFVNVFGNTTLLESYYSELSGLDTQFRFKTSFSLEWITFFCCGCWHFLYRHSSKIFRSPLSAWSGLQRKIR